MKYANGFFNIIFCIFELVILFCFNIPDCIIDIISVWVGLIGTIASVVLSIMAMIYSNKSSKDAEDSLKKVTSHYEALCKELTNQAIQKSLGKDSIERVLRNNRIGKDDN